MPHRHTLAAVLAASLVFLGAPMPEALAKGPLGAAEEAAEAEKIEPVVIRMYNVQDLTLGRDYPYRSAPVPVTAYGAGGPVVSEAAAGFAGLFGPELDLGDPAAMTSALTPEAVADLIVRTIDVESWQEYGGRGIIDRVGALLVVTQTEENQAKVAELLAQLRKARPMLTVEARWILLDRSETAKINTGAEQKKAPTVLTDKQADDLEEKAIYRGQLTCFDRQTTHLASGRVQTFMGDIEPVVGEGAVGYNPTVGSVLVGALLEVTPSLDTDRKGVTLNVRSIISETEETRTRRVASPASDKITSTSIDVELPQFMLHTFRTTLRAPVGRSVLIGGMTSPAAELGKELYLVLRVVAPEAKRE